MSYFNFSRLIAKYSRPFMVAVRSEGSYDSKGDWKEGEPIYTEINGAIMAISQRKVYNSNGIYTTLDKSLYMTSPIDKALLQAEIIFNDNVYKIEEVRGADNDVFTGVYNYILKYVSAFGGDTGD